LIPHINLAKARTCYERRVRQYTRNSRGGKNVLWEASIFAWALGVGLDLAPGGHPMKRTTEK
jgi:hypothetical protein